MRVMMMMMMMMMMMSRLVIAFLLVLATPEFSPAAYGLALLLYSMTWRTAYAEPHK